MSQRRSPADQASRGSRTSAYVVAIILGIVFALPFIYTVTRTLMESTQATAFPVQWIPDPLVLVENFVDGFERLGARAFFNSFILAITVIVGQIVLGMFAAFALTVLRLRFSNTMLLYFLLSLLIPFHVYMIPLFVIVAELDWLDTFQGLIIPVVASISLSVFLFRQFFTTVPTELFDAGVVDGANPLQILRHVYLPLSGPIIAAYSIITFLGAMNLFIWPLLVATAPDVRPVIVTLAVESSSNALTINEILAMAVLTMVPVLIVFMLFQRQFVQGIASTGLKG
jgi:multiple sugar transport system permease protein